MSTSVAIASDHAGFGLKQKLVAFLSTRVDVEVMDLGPDSATRCDYPDYAAAVARAVQSGEAMRGILVCGSGIGVSIAANRFKGVRAALAHNAVTAQLSRAHNDANILCLGSRLVGDVIAEAAVDAFLTQEFEQGRHAGRLAKISDLGGC